METTQEDIKGYTVKEILADHIVPRLDGIADRQFNHEKDDNVRFADLLAYKNRIIGGASVFALIVSIDTIHVWW